MSVISPISSAFSKPQSPPPQSNGPQNEAPAEETQSTSQNDETQQSDTSTGSGASGTTTAPPAQTTQEAPKAESAPPAETSKATSEVQQTKAVAESQVAAKAAVTEPLEDSIAQPARIEEDDAQALVVARAQAESYRDATAREQLLIGITNVNKVDKNGEKLDLRVPLIDELPDRPAPEVIRAAS